MANLIIEHHADILHGDVPKPVGKNWQTGFYFRNSNVIVERRHVLEQLRVNGASRLTLEHFFELFKEMRDLPDLLPENIYNMDETLI